MDEAVQRIDGIDSTSKLGCFGCSLVFLVVIGVPTTIVYFQLYPRNRVEILVKNIPVGTRFLCIVAETADGIKAMNWFPAKVVPFELPPDRLSYSSLDDKESTLNRHVKWDFGARYGVVTRRLDKAWWITWFRAEEVALTGRSALLGGGAAEFDLSIGITEQLSPDVVRHLGL